MRLKFKEDIVLQDSGQDGGITPLFLPVLVPGQGPSVALALPLSGADTGCAPKKKSGPLPSAL